MEVLHHDQLEHVSGGIMWAALIAFAFLNLEKLNDSLQGLVDGYNAGFATPGGDVGSTCTP